MYLFDANIFIEAKNTYYSFELVPGFWEWVRAEHHAGRIASISAVRDELLKQDDELSAWAKTLPRTFWLEESRVTIDALQRVAEWAVSDERDFTPAARAQFLSVADYRLVAAGLAYDQTVVTREQPASASRRSIKLPDACDAHGVKWLSPFDAFRRLELRLVRPE